MVGIKGKQQERWRGTGYATFLLTITNNQSKGEKDFNFKSKPFLIRKGFSLFFLFNILEKFMKQFNHDESNSILLGWAMGLAK